MYFSPKTIALVAASGLLSSAEVAASPLAERGSSSTQLCQKANYGAVGKPWESSSTPGSFCSKTKPSNSAAWQAIPYADGYDTVKCSTYTWSWTTWSWVRGGGLAVCNGGNKASKLPWSFNVPHLLAGKTMYVWGEACKGKTTTVTTTTTSCAKSTSTAAAATSTAAAATSTAVASAVVTSVSAAASSAVSAAGSAVSSAAVSSAAAVVTSAVSSAAASTVSAAAAATTTIATDPSTAPLCEVDFQVQYLNYTTVVPNGVWTGLTMGAAAQDASYMTYTLANTVDDCLAACDDIEGCVFVNTYYDLNPSESDLPKHSGVLTCAMFSACVPTSENDNWGGQDDPNYITESNGYCKSAACGASS
ncbi:hypothetical protein Q5752_005330 [Cryptotrichosporon argae]